MVFVKSLVFGIGGAVLASVLWITATVILPIFLPYVIARVRGTGGGAFGYVGSGSILIAALIGFIIAFAWAWHRLRAV